MKKLLLHTVLIFIFLLPPKKNSFWKNYIFYRFSQLWNQDRHFYIILLLSHDTHTYTPCLKKLFRHVLRIPPLSIDMNYTIIALRSICRKTPINRGTFTIFDKPPLLFVQVTCWKYTIACFVLSNKEAWFDKLCG